MYESMGAIEVLYQKITPNVLLRISSQVDGSKNGLWNDNGGSFHFRRSSKARKGIVAFGFRCSYLQIKPTSLLTPWEKLAIMDRLLACEVGLSVFFLFSS